MFSRVEEDYAADDDDIRVTYFRQSKGNVNFKFAPFLNDKRQQLGGVVHRSSILVTFDKFVTSGALPLTAKRLLATYGDTARGKETGLNFHLYLENKGTKVYFYTYHTLMGTWKSKVLTSTRSFNASSWLLWRPLGRKHLKFEQMKPMNDERGRLRTTVGGKLQTLVQKVRSTKAQALIILAHGAPGDLQGLQLYKGCWNRCTRKRFAPLSNVEARHDVNRVTTMRSNGLGMSLCLL